MLPGFSGESFAVPARPHALATILPIQSGPLGQVVGMRNLHGALQSKRQFGNWVQDNLKGATENVDFAVVNEVFNKAVKNPQGGRPRIEYVCTLRFAKKIAMMENTAKGNEVREYFLWCEDQVLSAPLTEDQMLAAMDDNAFMLKLILRKSEMLQAANAKIAANAPKVALAEAISAAENAQEFMEVAHDLGIGRQTLIDFLRSEEIGHLQKQRSPILPMRSFESQGLYEVDLRTRIDGKTGKPIKYSVTLVTSKGLDRIRELLVDHGLLRS